MVLISFTLFADDVDEGRIREDGVGTCEILRGFFADFCTWRRGFSGASHLFYNGTGGIACVSSIYYSTPWRETLHFSTNQKSCRVPTGTRCTDDLQTTKHDNNNMMMMFVV